MVWIIEACETDAARLGSDMVCVGGGVASALPWTVSTGIISAAPLFLGSIAFPCPLWGVPLILSSRACMQK
jgi:hypothetical protein